MAVYNTSLRRLKCLGSAKPPMLCRNSLVNCTSFSMANQYSKIRRFATTDVQKSKDPRSNAVSTFVKIKETTEEGISAIYVCGMLFLVLPGCFWMVIQALFSGGGEEKLRNDSFDKIRENIEVKRALGDDLFSNPIQYHTNFTDDEELGRGIKVDPTQVFLPLDSPQF